VPARRHPATYNGDTEDRYVRVCPDADGRYRITDSASTVSRPWPLVRFPQKAANPGANYPSIGWGRIAGERMERIAPGRLSLT